MYRAIECEYVVLANRHYLPALESALDMWMSKYPPIVLKTAAALLKSPVILVAQM
jgi:hypothetical protein